MPDDLPHPACTAILVAAGASRRMGTDKLVWPLDGVPVLLRTLDAFLRARSIGAIIVVCSAASRTLFKDGDFPKPVTFTSGGDERQDSVAAGLTALDPSTRLVAVHDGARPLVSPDDIDRCVEAAGVHRAAALARRANDTMKRSDPDGFCTGSVDRQNLWCMETPQVFEVSILRQAYRNVAERGLSITDEVSAVQALGIPVKLIESHHPNPKITTPADLALAEALARPHP